MEGLYPSIKSWSQVKGTLQKSFNFFLIILKIKFKILNLESI